MLLPSSAGLYNKVSSSLSIANSYMSSDFFDLNFFRVKRLKGQFAQLYVVATLSTKEQSDSFMRSYFQWVVFYSSFFTLHHFAYLCFRKWSSINLFRRYEMEFGKPAFVQVTDAEMGFEKIVKIAHSRGGIRFICFVLVNILYGFFSDWLIRFETWASVCKQQKVASKLKVEVGSHLL